jgi:predicted MFS family arabinose efflux permease
MHSNALSAERCGFIAYAILALIAATIYWSLTPAIEAEPLVRGAKPLAQSRAIVIRLAVLFSLDSFGGGLAIQSLLALWLFRRFQLSIRAAAAFFFVTGLLGAFSQLASSWFVTRIGRIRTMAYTHIPANVCLMIAGMMPNVELALTFLLLRATMSSMDVPARQSYVMAVVPPEERAAAASVTNVPRSLAAAMAPLPAGALLDYSLFGWPLILGGACKLVYDALLLAQFRWVTPPDEN